MSKWIPCAEGDWPGKVKDTPPVTERESFPEEHVETPAPGDTEHTAPEVDAPGEHVPGKAE